MLLSKEKPASEEPKAPLDKFLGENTGYGQYSGGKRKNGSEPGSIPVEQLKKHKESIHDSNDTKKPFDSFT